MCGCARLKRYTVEDTDIARASKRKRELTFNTDFGDLTLFQQAQVGMHNEFTFTDY